MTPRDYTDYWLIVGTAGPVLFIPSVLAYQSIVERKSSEVGAPWLLVLSMNAALIATFMALFAVLGSFKENFAWAIAAGILVLVSMQSIAQWCTSAARQRRRKTAPDIDS